MQGEFKGIVTGFETRESDVKKDGKPTGEKRTYRNVYLTGLDGQGSPEKFEIDARDEAHAFKLLEKCKGLMFKPAVISATLRMYNGQIQGLQLVDVLPIAVESSKHSKAA